MSKRVDALYSGATELQSRIRPAVRVITNRLWRFDLQGFEQLPETGPAILCANHVSFLDSAFLIIQAPRNISFVGKSEYLDSWKTRRLFPALGMIPVDREGGEKAQQTGDITGSPIARNKALRKTNIARLHRLRKRFPVMQMQTGVQRITMGLTKLRDLAGRPMHCQYAVFQLFK